MSNVTEPGIYNGVITNAALGESGTKKTPLVAINVKLTDDEVNGKTVTSYHYITEKTFESTMDLLIALGYPHGDWDHLNSDNPERHDFSGVEVKVQCKIVPDQNGQDRSQFTVLNPNRSKPVEKSVISDLNKKFKFHKSSSTKPSTPSNGTAAKPAQAQKPPVKTAMGTELSNDDNETPF